MTDNLEKKNNHNWVYVLIGLLCVIVAIVSIVLFLLQGKTTVTSQENNVEVTESISCSGEDIAYPFFKHDDADKRSIKINAIFDNDKLQSITLTYKMYYDDKDVMKKRNAENHADLNSSYGEDSLGAGAFDTRFSELEDALQLSLYAEAKEINGVSLKYFLLDGSGGGLKKDKITKAYNEKGLDCVIKQ